MITGDQNLCPTCSLEYTEFNLPRVLTMCGHTFCDACVKGLIPSKKVSGQFRIVCPLDKMVIEIERASTEVFPKNLCLLEMLRKKAA